ncbi:MAG: helix-turn-helix transcriptional regulator [Ruminiclostridium sp.]|nr:helix-turn-helix transcriptional regulator [Ruminiclostridium sp.]
MAIGERIRFIRNLRGMTLKMLGKSVGFDDNTADVRMAQYEKGTRTPKADLTAKIAETLEVAPEALAVPNIENYVGVMHTLFALEDLYGLRIDKLDDEICIRLDKDNGTEYLTMLEMFRDWQTQAERCREGEITEEEYDNWRYNYPRETVRKKRASLRKKRTEK